MNFIMTVFGYPFGWLMYGLYHLVSNYGVALVLFTLIVKLLLFPLGLKQQKSTVKMQIIQPKIQEIQAKYKNNQAKMNEELQALYAKENYNPMSGCGTLLIQFPVIFGLLDVVYKPLTHLLRFSKETIAALTEVAAPWASPPLVMPPRSAFTRALCRIPPLIPASALMSSPRSSPLIWASSAWIFPVPPTCPGRAAGTGWLSFRCSPVLPRCFLPLFP